MTVKHIVVGDTTSKDCKIGVVRRFTVFLEDFSAFSGNTCQCGNGCNGCDKLPHIGQEFKNTDALYDYVYGTEE